MDKVKKLEVYPLLTTRADQFTYDEYVDYCIEEGIEYGEPNSMEFYDWCEEEARITYDCNMENLTESEIADRTFVIEGTLGLWDGNHTINPIVVKGIVPAINRCFGRDIDNIDVELDTKDGVIHVNASHHDGTNCFTLKMLNKNGEKALEDADEFFELKNNYWTKLKSINDIWK